MTTIVYTTGYQGTRLDDLEAFLRDNDADLFDIRFKPWSPNPTYSKTSLQERFGDRYHHVVALGNRLYKTNNIELVDYAGGVKQIQANTRPVVLLCACADSSNCHRTFVGKSLAEQGFSVTELRNQSTSDQPIQERLL